MMRTVALDSEAPGLDEETRRRWRLLAKLHFRIKDPISGTQASGGGVSITGGHHRIAEIVRRVQTGQLPADTPVPFLLHD